VTPTGDPASPAAPDLASQLASERSARETVEQRLREVQTREGRLRNDLGAYRNRLRELEDASHSDNTGPPTYGDPTPTGYTPQYNANPYGPAPDPMTTYRQNQDLLMFKVDHPESRAVWDELQKLVNDPAKVGDFISYRTVPHSQTGQPYVEPDVARTYQAALREIELRTLKAEKAASSPPTSNPAFGVISGVSASNVEGPIDLSNLTPEQIREKFPEAFAAQQTKDIWGR
jgi:hypothetical protein